jgi:sugar phosphate isomerase/epimerase
MTPHEYREATRNGLTATDLLEMAAETGIALRHLDTVTGWAPIRFPSGAGADIVERFDFSMEEVLDIASSIEADTLLAFPAYDHGVVPLQVAVEGFANLCDRAEEAGLWVNLEFAPMLGLPNLADAWEVVRLADRPNSGIMLDTWHFARGDADLGLLRSIPGERLRDVQLADGARIPRGNSLLEDCVRFRMFPGEGDLPIIEPLRIIYGKGSLRSIGPEVFSDSADALSAEEAGRLSGTSLRHSLTSAGIRARSP